MALRDQPYIPLFIQDFLTDEKLIECSAESTGVYIRLMCIMHKSNEYGTILLKQKDKQTTKHLLNFATKLAKHMPYSVDLIEKSLDELITEGVIDYENDKLLQRRMIKDNSISLKRSKAGSKGGFATQFALAKSVANSEYEYEYENEGEIEVKKGGIIKGGGKKFIPPTREQVAQYCTERGNDVDPDKWYDFYEAKGWMIGKNKMKDWKAAVRTWEKKNNAGKSDSIYREFKG